MELKDMHKEVEGFKEMVNEHKRKIMNRLMTFSNLEMDTEESREYSNQLMTHIQSLNLTVSCLESDIKSIQRKLDKKA